jgi:hypothetical protein
MCPPPFCAEGVTLINSLVCKFARGGLANGLLAPYLSLRDPDVTLGGTKQSPLVSNLISTLAQIRLKG